MKKMPTIFIRDKGDRSRVTGEISPAAQWVFDGEGRLTRKYDGTCVMYDGDRWWSRREVKGGKSDPPNFRPLGEDPVTGKRMGWEPAEQSGFYKYLFEASGFDEDPDHPVNKVRWPAGTYELCGPRINGNPEDYSAHVLKPHGWETLSEREDLRRFHQHLLGHQPGLWRGLLLGYLMECNKWHGGPPWEGLVWHHEDGRRAKIKRRDLMG